MTNQSIMALHDMVLEWPKALDSCTAAPIHKRSGVKELSQLSDQVVVEQILAGQHDLVDVLVRRYSDKLFHIIRRMVSSRETADDLLQDTWLRVIRKLQKFDKTRELLPWLIQIAINGCRDHLRKDRLRRYWKRSPPSEGHELKEHFVSEYNHQNTDNHVELERALMVLSRKQREVVVLKFYSGLTHDEIAHILHIPSGTVKSRLHTALITMREHLGERS